MAAFAPGPAAIRPLENQHAVSAILPAAYSHCCACMDLSVEFTAVPTEHKFILSYGIMHAVQLSAVSQLVTAAFNKYIA